MPELYSILLQPAAAKALTKLPKRELLKIAGAIELLGSNPLPPAAIKLKNSAAYRIRIGDYRVIYEVHSQVLEVLGIRIGHRPDVYHQL